MAIHKGSDDVSSSESRDVLVNLITILLECTTKHDSVSKARRWRLPDRYILNVGSELLTKRRPACLNTNSISAL